MTGRTLVYRFALILLAALLATLAAGMVGGAVLFLASYGGPAPFTVTAFPGALVAGAMFGSVLATPVTLLVIPAVYLLSLWLWRPSPLLTAVTGFLAGGVRMVVIEGGLLWSQPDYVSVALAVGGACGGLAGGGLFAFAMHERPPLAGAYSSGREPT